MMKVQILVLSVAGAIITTIAFGFGTLAAQQNACAAPRDGYDNVYCLMKIYLSADDDLNVNYRSLAQRLNREGKSILKRYQIQWIDARNATCSRSEGNGFYVNVRCSLDETQTRVAFLRERINECRSVGCINSRIK